MANDKMTKTEVATMLKEALEPFCETLKDLRPALAHPFRQEDCVMASDGHILISIKAKEAGVSIGKFKEMTDFNAHKAIPQLGFDDLLQARIVERSDLLAAIDEMKRLEGERQQVIAADVLGVWLSMNTLSRIEVALRICGAEAAQLVWHKDDKVVVQLYNAKGEACVTILSMGFKPKDAHVIALPTHDDDDRCSVAIDWQRGDAAWADIKAELARQEEAERMARREVYMVEVVKRAYIPVYAKDADEARRLCESEWLDPEDDGDDEWMLGDTVPEVEDLDDMDDCYEHVITRDGIVERDKTTNSTRLARSGQKNIRRTDTMKIVDRKTFMRMPKGTVFCKFPRFNEATRSYADYLFGISEPYVKMDDTDGESVDFCAMGIGSGLEPIGSTGRSDTDDILTDMERNPGKEVAFEYSYGRDGMYEGDEVGFAIFSRDEVMLMIRTLRESLATAYKPEEKPMQRVTAYYYRIGELMGEPEIADGGRVVLHFAGGCGLHRCSVYDQTVFQQSQCCGDRNGYLTTTDFRLAEPIEGEDLEQLAFVLPYNGRYINSYQHRFGYTVCCDGRGRIEATGIFKSPQGDVTEPEKMVVKDF